MLDDGAPELEQGALSPALQLKTGSLDELAGFYAALAGRVYVLYPPHGALHPLAAPTYHGARRHPNLTPLPAILLSGFGVPVLLHGALESAGRTTTACILREPGILPCARIEQAQAALVVQRLAFVPTAVLCPGLGTLLIQRAWLGVRTIAHRLLPLLDPFFGDSVRLVSTCHPLHLARLRRFLQSTDDRALLLRGVQGEPRLRLRQRGEIECLAQGERNIFVGLLPQGETAGRIPLDAAGTASWMREVIDGGRHKYWPSRLPVRLRLCVRQGQALTIVAGELGLPRPFAHIQEAA